MKTNQTEWQPNVPEWFREQQEPPREPAPPSVRPKIVFVALMIVLALTAWVASLRLYGQAQYQAGEKAGLSNFLHEHQGKIVAFPATAEQLQEWLNRESGIDVYFGTGTYLFPRQSIKIIQRNGVTFRNLNVDGSLMPENEPLFHLRHAEGVSIEGGTVRRDQ